MGYAKNSRAHLLVANQLAEMLSAKGERELQWLVADPVKTSYHIRDAFRKDEYAPLKALYIIRTRGSYVIAEPRVKTKPAQFASLDTLNIPEATELLEVIGAAIEHKRARIHFPNAELSNEDLHKLHKWTSANGYYIVPTDTEITLTKENPGILAWTPHESS